MRNNESGDHVNIKKRERENIQEHSVILCYVLTSDCDPLGIKCSTFRNMVMLMLDGAH